MKHLVTSGCSFSDVDNSEKPWPLHLQDLTQDRFDNFYHLGACSQGQDYISRTVIYKVNELLKNNNSDDIFVIVAWSGLQRRAILVNEESKKMHYQLKDRIVGEWELMRECAIGSWTDFNEEYLKIHSVEQNIIQSLEHIIRTQDFLKLNNVDYKFFGFGNLFANPYNHPGEARFGFLTEVPGGTELVPTIKEQFPHTSYLFDMMDWNKWWFYNQWGGLGEWVNSNIENGFDGADGISGHPRSESHKTFTKEVVLKWIK